MGDTIINEVAGLVSGLFLILFTVLKPFEGLSLRIQEAHQNSIDHWVLFECFSYVVTLDNVFQILSAIVCVMSLYKMVKK